MKNRRSRSANEHLTKRVMESFKSSTLAPEYTILGVEAQVHRFGLSGGYLYEDLEKEFGKPKINSAYIPQDRMPNYRTEAYLPTEIGTLTVFLNPKEPFLPKCIIEKSYPTREFLGKLARLFPRLSVYSVEYALDVYCCDLVQVASLFWTLRRYLYVPHARKVEEYGRLLFRVEEMVEVRRFPAAIEALKNLEGAVFRAGDWKVYPRGADELREGRSWFCKDLDRVRMEFTAEGYHLAKHRITRLRDFIKGPKFREILENRLKFKKFKDSSKRFPKEWEGYNSGSFEGELIQLRKRGVKNPSQYITDAEGFGEFKLALTEAMEEFDREWKV